MNLSDTAVSYIRTYSPALAGLIIGWLVSMGLPVSGDAKDGLTAVLVVAFTCVWYALVRYAEKRWPAAGWLLGYPKAPSYGTAGKGGSAQISTFTGSGGSGKVPWGPSTDDVKIVPPEKP